MREYGELSVETTQSYTILFQEKYISVPKIHFTILPNANSMDVQLSMESIDTISACIRVSSHDLIKVTWIVEGHVKPIESNVFDVNYFM